MMFKRVCRPKPIAEPLESRRLLAANLTFALNPYVESNVVGEALNLKGAAQFRNDGDAATGGPVSYRVVLTTSSTVDTDLTVLGSGTVPDIAAGESDVIVNFDFPAPLSLVGETRLLGILIDPDDAIAENDEDDNEAIHSSAIDIVPTLVGTSLVGSAGNDSFTFRQVDDALIIVSIMNSTPATRIASVDDLPQLTLDLLGGDDLARVEFNVGVSVPLIINGGDGNDSITGGAAGDVISGNAGDDRLDGGGGDDHLIGGPQSDRLRGQEGNDTVSGNGGRDFLAGNAGADSLIGGAGNDVLADAGGSDVDTLSGGAGTDVAESDVSDLLASIEQ